MEPKRYRSRGRQPKAPQSQAEDVHFSAASTTSLTSTTPPADVSRSPSRYRRRRAATVNPSTSDLNLHPVPDIPSTFKDSQTTPMTMLHDQSHQYSRVTGSNAQRPRTGSERSLSGEDGKIIVASSTWPLNYDANGQKITRQNLREKGVREEITSVSPPGRDGFARHFGKLRKRRTDETIPSRPQTGTEEQTRNVSSGSRSSEGEPYAFIKAGGGGVTPGIDAPRSAVNAGDRYVMVECGRASVSLPITPSTTVSDLIKTASNYLSESIDPQTSVLLESFGKVGVQRPLRKYERVRDVMNSWDFDTQNELVLVDSANAGRDRDLCADGVPNTKPGGCSQWLYYSQKVGKWDKRWVTIRDDGQITLSKNESSIDAINICHLSDFDIYSPMPKQLNKKIKPPKKICFAIKSQQKLAFFASSKDFVQFFCTSDRNVATQFYTMVQNWRSWYLVNVLGEGQRKTRSMGSCGEDMGRRSSFESPYQSRLARGNSISRKKSVARDKSAANDTKGLDSRTMYNRMMSLRTKAPPPVSFPGYVAQLPDVSTNRKGGPDGPKGNLPDTCPDSEFASSGLLGHQYSIKQNTSREKEMKEKAVLTQADSNQYHNEHSRNENTQVVPRRSSTLRSNASRKQTDINAGESSDLKRNRSVKHGVMKPLVDLTPQNYEPPQHQRKGHRFVPEQTGPGRLIESATSPDDAIAIPPSKDWRARENIVNGGNSGLNNASTHSNEVTSINGFVNGNDHINRDHSITKSSQSSALPPANRHATTTLSPITATTTASTPEPTSHIPTLPLKSAKRANSVRKPHSLLNNNTNPASITTTPSNPPTPVPIIPNNSNHNHNHDRDHLNTSSGGNNNNNNDNVKPQSNGAINNKTIFNPYVPFAQSSLLGRSVPDQDQGKGIAVAWTGKGVMTGANAKGPMLDLTEQSKFIPGSLLAGVEMDMDRDKDMALEGKTYVNGSRAAGVDSTNGVDERYAGTGVAGTMLMGWDRGGRLGRRRI